MYLFLIAECKKKQIILMSHESKSQITKNTSDNCDLSKSFDLGLKMPQTHLESINHWQYIMYALIFPRNT